MTWTAPADLDPECLEICTALNQLTGIMTVESCCGHGRQPYRIFFFADTFEALTIVAYCVAGCHSGAYDWRVIARTDCTPQPVSFMIEGPAGDYEGSRKIAAAVGKWISESGA